MEKKSYTCIVCPKSCKGEIMLHEGEMSFSGYLCKRGEKYAESEYTNPKRLLSTTVKIRDAAIHRLPVVSDGEIGKDRLIECIEFLYTLTFQAPIKEGDILIKDILGTGVSIIAAMDIKTKK
jgi:CxxC motif-containing protein